MSREELSAALAKMNADVAAAGGKMTVGTPRALVPLVPLSESLSLTPLKPILVLYLWLS